MAVGSSKFVDLVPESSLLLDSSIGGHPKPKFEGNQSKECFESGTFRKSYTTEFKLSVVEWVENHKSSVRAAAKQFGVDRKLVRMWLSHKAQLHSALLQHGPNKRKLHSGRPPASQELDRLMYDFLCEQKSDGISVRDRDLQQKALAIAHDLGMESFKATSQWVRRWRQRCSVQVMNGVNQAASDPLSSTAMLTHVRPGEQVKLHANAQRKAPPTEDTGTPMGTLCVGLSSREHNYYRSHEGGHTNTEFYDVIESLDLPFGHEEVIDNKEHLISCTPHACRTSLRSHPYKNWLPSDYKQCASCLGLASRISVPVFPTGPEIVYIDVPNSSSPAW